MNNQQTAMILAVAAVMLGILSALLMYLYGFAPPTLAAICVGILCACTSYLISSDAQREAKSAHESPGDCDQ